MESQSTKPNQIKPNHNNNHFNYRVNKSGHYVERRTKTTYVISISAIFTRQADGFDCGRSNGYYRLQTSALPNQDHCTHLEQTVLLCPGSLTEAINFP